MAEQATASSFSVDPVTQQRNLRAGGGAEDAGWFKNIVGGFVEQLFNTCQLENNTIGNLATVVTIMITAMQSLRLM